MTSRMKILVGYDGSACADVALDDLQRAGLPADVEAMVLSVADVVLLPTGEALAPASANWLTPMTREAQTIAARHVKEAEELAARGCARLQNEFPTWAVSSSVCAASPGWGLIQKAEELRAHIIVVGSHGRSTLGRLILGSVSQRVVTQAHCSVRVARAHGAERGRPLRILVAVDGSMPSEVAVREVAKRSWPVGTTVRVITVLDPMLLTTLAFTSLAEERMLETPDASGQLRAHRLAEAAADIIRLRAPTLTVSTVVKDGDPKQLILEEAEAWGADCIFMGARGRNERQRLWLGSVSATVTARAHCSVEVVRSLAGHGID